MDNRRDTVPSWLLWPVASAIVAAVVGVSAWVADGPPAVTINPTPRPGEFVTGSMSLPPVVALDDDSGGADRHVPNHVHGPCEILRVIDGDTMEVRIPLWNDTVTTRRVRVWGCDTPERKAATLVPWKAATEYTRGWSTRHNDIRVLYMGVDSLGRHLCMVMGDDEAGNEHMLHVDLIAAGHAVKRESK